MKKTKDYVVAFGDWIIEAKNEEEVLKIVRKKLSKNDYPTINFIEEN